MKEIIKITVALTISCLVAGLVIGTTFIFTARAKQHNEHLNVQQTMLGLLGMVPGDPQRPTSRCTRFTATSCAMRIRCAWDIWSRP